MDRGGSGAKRVRGRGVSHFGESPVYGVETIDPSVVLDPSDRVIDCSFALDHVLGGSVLPGIVDPSRVGAVGHSSGGATAIALAGGLFDPAAMARYCASEEAAEDRGCAYGRRPAAAPRIPPAPRSHHDPRVRAVVALDPALGPGFDPDSLSEIFDPCARGGCGRQRLPAGQRPRRPIRGVDPRMFVHSTVGGEGHFVYLNECDSDLDANGVPLCRDRPGVDRRAVHASLGPLIGGFFDANL